MYHKIRQKIRQMLEQATSEVLKPDEIQESEICDFTSPIAFKLAGKLRKNPKELAEEIAGKIEAGNLQRVEAVNGHINFFLDYSELISPVMNEISSSGDSYGRGEPKKKKIILEHTSINPSGPVHVGRLRNSLIGDSLARILRFDGYRVETHYYVNDIGKQIAIIAQGFIEEIGPDKEAIKKYRSYAEKEDFKIFFQYVSANRKFESDEEFAQRVQSLIRDAEEGNTKALDEIAQVAGRCLEGQKEIFRKLGINFDFFDFESGWIKEDKIKSVFEFLKNGEHFKTAGAGSGLDLSPFGLEREGGISVLTRSDGTSVYLLRDIAYHLEKAERGDMMLDVLGEDHKFEFQEIKTILQEIYKLKVPLEVIHYSFVNFEGEELSTRKGQIAPVDGLIDEAVEKAEKEIEKRGIAGKDTAPIIGIGAIKYHILKTTPQKPITFSWERALNFDGDASPYIQYAHARCCSILRRSGTNLNSINIDNIDKNLEELEKNLLFMLLKFPAVVGNSAAERKPNTVANYLYELAHSLNRFYRECPVLPAEQGVKERRLLLVNATRQVLNALNLLGIEAPERM